MTTGTTGLATGVSSVTGFLSVLFPEQPETTADKTKISITGSNNCLLITEFDYY
jgi:hypothetical protein